MNAGLIDRLTHLVDDAAARMLSIPDDEAAAPRAPGKWSRKEIIGHLIDSAINNHARFVRARVQDDLVFEGYDQDAWVRLQAYRERSWPALIRAWRTYNVQIAEVMRHTPREDLERRRPRHNLHEITFTRVPATASVTLGCLLRDYVAHLEHHLQQVLG